MRLLPWLVVLVVTLAAAPAASGAYTVEPTLTRVAGVETRCYATGEPRWAIGGGGGYAWGWYDVDVIGLRAWVCRGIQPTLAGRKPDAFSVATSWWVFSHEVAHARGFDHGEATVGADCRGWRIMRPLMRAAGIGRGYAFVLWRLSAHRANCP